MLHRVQVAKAGVLTGERAACATSHGNNNVQLAFHVSPENKGVFSVKLVKACHMMPQYILGICVPTCQLRSGHCQWAWNSFIPGHPNMMTAYANKVTPSFLVGNAMGYGSAKNIKKLAAMSWRPASVKIVKPRDSIERVRPNSILGHRCADSTAQVSAKRWQHTHTQTRLHHPACKRVANRFNWI